VRCAYDVHKIVVDLNNDYDNRHQITNGRKDVKYWYINSAWWYMKCFYCKELTARLLNYFCCLFPLLSTFSKIHFAWNAYTWNV